MKALDTIQTLSRIGRILSKIARIFSIIGLCGCVAGLLSLTLGRGGLIKLGGVTLHSFLDERFGYNIKSICAALSGWLILCAGEAVLAGFAERYFKNELQAGTPFTTDGAKELRRLGILTLCIPTGCALAARIAEGVLAGMLKIERADMLDLCTEGGAHLALGVMFLFVSLLCRNGTELQARE